MIGFVGFEFCICVLPLYVVCCFVVVVVVFGVCVWYWCLAFVI